MKPAFPRKKEAYRYPPLSLLTAPGPASRMDGTEEMRASAVRLSGALESFGIEAKITNITRGPSVTRYEYELDKGVKLNKVTNLADDIALSLGATGVRIAPIPDKISVVGMEVPNKLVSTVYIREVLASQEFKKHSLKSFLCPGQGHRRKLHYRRHRKASPSAHRGHHRLGQIRLYEFSDHQPFI